MIHYGTKKNVSLDAFHHNFDSGLIPSEDYNNWANP